MCKNSFLVWFPKINKLSIESIYFPSFPKRNLGGKKLQTCHRSTSVHKSISCPSIRSNPRDIFFQWNMTGALVLFSAIQSVSMAALRDSLATMSRISWLWNFSIFFTSCAWSVLYSKHCKRKLLNIRFRLNCFLSCLQLQQICAWKTQNKVSI